MMMGHFISRLFESALHVEKNTRAIQNRKHCACATRSSPPADSPVKNVYACSAKMTRYRFRVMTLAPGRKCPGNVVQMKRWQLLLAVIALQFLSTVSDQKLFWSKF